MIPVPIPPGCVPDACRRVVVGPPSGDPTDDEIRPVEAVVGVVDGAPRFAMLVQLEAGELERLAAMETPAIWLTQLTNQLVPFALHVADAEEWPT